MYWMIKRFALVGRTSFGMCNVYSEMTSKARVSLQRVCVRALCWRENVEKRTQQQKQRRWRQKYENAEIHRHLMVVRSLLLLQRLVLLPLVVVVIPLSRQSLCVSWNVAISSIVAAATTAAAALFMYIEWARYIYIRQFCLCLFDCCCWFFFSSLLLFTRDAIARSLHLHSPWIPTSTSMGYSNPTLNPVAAQHSQQTFHFPFRNCVWVPFYQLYTNKHKKMPLFYIVDYNSMMQACIRNVYVPEMKKLQPFGFLPTCTRLYIVERRRCIVVIYLPNGSKDRWMDGCSAFSSFTYTVPELSI